MDTLMQIEIHAENYGGNSTVAVWGNNIKTVVEFELIYKSNVSH